MRITAAGKFFQNGTSRFCFRGVNGDGCAAPDAIAAAGFTVLAAEPGNAESARTAAESGLRILLRQQSALWNELPGASRRRQRQIAARMAGEMRDAVSPWAGGHDLLGVLSGTDVPPAVRARLQPEAAFRVASEVAARLHDLDPELLIGAACWPGVGCPVEADFAVADLAVGYRSQRDLVRALMEAHLQVGDRPLVMAGSGAAGRIAAIADAANEAGAAGTLLSRTGEPAWSPAALTAATSAHRRTVADLRMSWPSLTVVVCAYNAAGTLEECLAHCDRLDYPRLEVLVVDDGSTDATPDIAAAHPKARLLRVPHVGLAAARNAGYQAARGELIAYLDADAYPTLEWPWYLALAACRPGVGAAGGPNVPPPGEPPAAMRIALAPGGPIPQLASPEHAVHVPGCNLAVRKTVLQRLHGFDPALWSAEDVDFEHRLLEAGEQIGYHPAAFIWHHRRPGIRPYVRQQRNYGRGQALTEHRYEERFPRGRRLRRLTRVLRPPAKRQQSPVVAYRTLHWRERPLLDLIHQWGVPLAVLVAATAPLGIASPILAIPAAAAVGGLVGLFLLDVVLAGVGCKLPAPQLLSRVHIAGCRFARPLAFRVGRWSEGAALRRERPDWPPTPASLSAASELA